MLTVLGLIMVLSASAPGEVAEGASAYSVFKKQLLYVGVGAIVFLIVLRIPLRTIRHGSTMAMLVCVILLVLVLTPLGSVLGGAQSWFTIGPVSFQPIEPAKLALRAAASALAKAKGIAVLATFAQSGRTDAEAQVTA